MATRRVVFVCSGNICRSPMAAVIGKDLFAKHGKPAVIISGGTLELIGKRAASNAIAAVQELGLDLSSHRSQGTNPALLQMADDIVVMAPRHTAELTAKAPRLGAKIVELWRFYPTDAPGAPLTQIEDPVGQDLQTFRESRDIILACLDDWIQSL